MIIKLTCEYCGIEYEDLESQVKNSKHHFCTRACRGLWMTGRIGENSTAWNPNKPVYSCATCGNPIRVSPNKAKRNKSHFCCKECSNKYKIERPLFITHRKSLHKDRIKIICSFCGKTFDIWPCELKGRKNKFCSMKCRDNWRSENESGVNSHAWKGGWERYYGPNWKAQRRAARKRDKYICQHCGINEKEYGKALDVHHIKPFMTFGYFPELNNNYKSANRLSNLISLCSNCHSRSEKVSYSKQLPLFRSSYSASHSEIVRTRKHKVCPRCHTEKTIEEFSMNKSTSDGRCSYCNQCHREYNQLHPKR